MAVAFLYVDGVLSLILNGKSKTVRADHPNYNAILRQLKDGTEEELQRLLDPDFRLDIVKVKVEDLRHNRIKVVNGKVLFDNMEVHGTIVDRMLAQHKADLGFDNLMNLMLNASENPEPIAVQEMYDFLETRSLPVTEDGYIIAYKAVRHNWYDKYSGTILNNGANAIKMDRELCDNDRSRHCSAGLHVGGLDYVYQYGGNNDRIVLCKIHPKNIVSVPDEYTGKTCQKMRVCEP